MNEKKGMNRREFLKAATAATGGSLLLLNGISYADTQTGVKKRMKSLAAVPQPATPRRLSDFTHELAERGLSGEFRKQTVPLGTDLGQYMDCSGMSEAMRYARSVELIAEKAPIRILPGERIVGAETVAEGMWARVPIYGKESVHHTTIGFDKALNVGYKGLRQEIDDRLTRGGLDELGIDNLKGMRICLDAASKWHGRYIAALKDLIAKSSGEEQANYRHVLDNLRYVPENPPTSFAEAVQSLWFMFEFQRLCGTFSGIGRIDEMLGSYLTADLKNSKITLDEARELIAHFWAKGTEWALGKNGGTGSGDAQYYQNVILSGIDKNGHDVTNEVTYLVLDVVEELHISDFPIAVRLNKNTPTKLLRKIAEVQRHGGGIVAVYNEDVVIEALRRFGYPLEEARSYTNDGCWEAIIPGKTTFIYSPRDALQILQRTLDLNNSTNQPKDYADFESLYADFKQGMQQEVDSHRDGIPGWCTNGDPAALAVAPFIEGCIEKGRDYRSRGPKYTVCAIHFGGLANVGNSLLAIQKLVYEQKLLSLPEFVNILRSNWQGQESLRNMVLNRVATYGNDDSEADAMVKRVYDDYTAIAAAKKESGGVLCPAGISTFGREIEWLPNRTATADGHHKGDILATNFSPSPGTDSNGPTAALKSYCKMDFTKLPNMGTLELKILPSSVQGEAGIRAMVGIMRSFVRLGGCFIHMDVVDSAMLLDAQMHPDKYPNLSVRIAGWSARFATLTKDWQDMVINRTQQII